MITPAQAIELVQSQARYSGHDPEALERGLVPFATLKQAGYIAGLLRKCDCPEEWRLWLTGQLVGRELRSSKDLSMAEASAILDFLIVGSDGRGTGPGPCEEAEEVIGLMLVHALAHVAMREGERVEVIQQPGLC